MKIGQISHVYLPHIGGLENYVYRLKQFLENNSNEVRVYTCDFGIRNKAMSIKDKNVIYCKTNFSILRNPFSFDLIKKLKQSNEDIYHLHSYEFLSSLFATLILKNEPKVLTQHGVEIEGSLRISLLSKVYHPLVQYILENMDRIIVLSKKDKAFLLDSFKLAPNKIIIIPNGIDTKKFKSNDENNRDFITRYNLNGDSFKILFVSKLVEMKNPHKLISAVTKYLQNKNIEVIMVGGGDPRYIEYLRSISDNRIHILGELNIANPAHFNYLVAAYSVSNLFVFLSSWEGLPTVLLEAMAGGLPIVTTSVGCVSEVITDGENGLFIDLPINEKELAEKIEYFMGSDNTEMAEANRAKVNSDFNWEIIAEQIYGVYQSVLKDYK